MAYSDAGNHGSHNFRDDPIIEGPWRIYRAVDPERKPNPYINSYVVFSHGKRKLIRANSIEELFEILHREILNA